MQAGLSPPVSPPSAVPCTRRALIFDDVWLLTTLQSRKFIPDDYYFFLSVAPVKETVDSFSVCPESSAAEELIELRYNLENCLE
jgi:hypothetical protein